MVDRIIRYLEMRLEEHNKYRVDVEKDVELETAEQLCEFNKMYGTYAWISCMEFFNWKREDVLGGEVVVWDLPNCKSSYNVSSM